MAISPLADGGDQVPTYYATALSQMSPIDGEILYLISQADALEDLHPGLQFGGSHYEPRFISESAVVSAAKDEKMQDRVRVASIFSLVSASSFGTRISSRPASVISCLRGLHEA